MFVLILGFVGMQQGGEVCTSLVRFQVFRVALMAANYIQTILSSRMNSFSQPLLVLLELCLAGCNQSTKSGECVALFNVRHNAMVVAIFKIVQRYPWDELYAWCVRS